MQKVVLLTFDLCKRMFNINNKETSLCGRVVFAKNQIWLLLLMGSLTMP